MKRYKIIDPGEWYPSIWGYKGMRACIPDTHPIKALFLDTNDPALVRRPVQDEIATEVLNVPYNDGRIILQFNDGKYAVIHRTGVAEVRIEGRNKL